MLPRFSLAAGLGLTLCACWGGEDAPAGLSSGATAPSPTSEPAPAAPRGKGKHKELEAPRQDVIPADVHPGDGTARMAARLAKLAQLADPAKDMYLNLQRVPLFEHKLAEAKAKGAKAIDLKLSLAAEKLLAGRPEEAASDFETLLANLEAKGATLNPEFHRQVLDLLAQCDLRIGEQGNCVMHHTPDACLMPIAEAGRHMDPTGSRKAMAVLRPILSETPDDYAARWLLNVAAQTLGEWPDGVPPEFLVPPEAFASAQDVGRFPDVAAACGLADRGLAGGACMEDFDGDGLLDIATSEWSLDGPLRFYRNDGEGHFTERGAQAGFAGLVGGLNLLHADPDNDGDADILVLRGAWTAESGARYPLSLLQNDGHGTFRDVTEEAGLLCFLSTQSAAWADYDLDGWLDLFVANESVGAHRFPCRLFHNLGDGRFEQVAERAGVDVVGYVKGSGWGDYDNDGDPDLYLSRMDGPKLLFRNEGDGTFTDVAEAAGVTGQAQSFPTWWFDYDNDGWLDLFVCGYRFGQTAEVCKDYLGLPNEGVTPRLYHNEHDGTFDDVTQAQGLMHVLPAMGCNYGDLDDDGFLDFYLATGEPDLKGIYPNRLWRNDAGQRFVDVTTSADVGHIQKGHAVCFGDLDNDGDQDLYTVMGGAFAGDGFQRVLFENPGHGNHWVTLRLQGVRANRAAIGARLALRVRRPDGSTRVIRQMIGTGGSFGSESLQAEIGLSDATAIEEVEIRWPGSATQVLKDLPLDRSWTIVEGGQPQPLERPRFKLGG
ncbi:MAG TPA: CRTAC1 family protein [Planctomycetota bacterium]|nr:CRTAC1 family protein [Planctomycetota bacterium]